MKTLENKIIIYDSNCKVCSSLRDVVLTFTSIPDSKVKAFKDLPEKLIDKVDPGKFKNVMALIDLQGEKTIYGAEGVAYIFSSQYKIVDFLLSFKPLFWLFSFLYKTQAYNRYIIATPKSDYACDCYPDKLTKYRISYITLAVFLSIILTGLFGHSLKDFFFGITSLEASIQMLLIAGTGWVLQILTTAVFLREKWLDYFGHLASIMVVGLLILVPSMLFKWITGMNLALLPGVSVVLSSDYMLYLHIGRIRHLQLSQFWSLTWFLYLQVTALFWIFWFHLK